MQRLKLTSTIRLAIGLALAAVAIPFACKTPTSGPAAEVKDVGGDAISVSESWTKDVKIRLDALRASREQVDGAAESLAFAAASTEEASALGDFLNQVESNLESIGQLLAAFDRAIKEGKVEGDLANSRQVAKNKPITVTVKVKTPEGLVEKPVQVDAGFAGVASRLKTLRATIEADILLKAGELLQQAPAARLAALKALRASLNDVSLELGVVIAAVDTWFGEGGDGQGVWTDPRHAAALARVAGDRGRRERRRCVLCGLGRGLGRGTLRRDRSGPAAPRRRRRPQSLRGHRDVLPPRAAPGPDGLERHGLRRGPKVPRARLGVPVLLCRRSRGPADVAPPPPPTWPVPSQPQPTWPTPPQPTWPPQGGGFVGCGSYSDSAEGRISCKSQSGCDWDYTFKECFSTKVADCPNYSKDSAERRIACKSTSGCDWDYTVKDCFYTQNQGCYYYGQDSAERRIACKSTSGCDWNYTTKQCVND